MAIGDVPFIESMQRTCVVLGGRTFLGKSLVFKLLKLGNWIVRVADSTRSLEIEDDEPGASLLSQALSDARASYCHVDVRDKSQIQSAIEGSSVVFYMVPDDLDTDDFYMCYMTIVQGAKNVITACQDCRVRQLVYNSSADIVFDGSCDIVNGDETLSCNWKDMMIDLRAQAEALVLYANSVDGVLTCALRPSNIFGPGDSQLVPVLLNLAKSGWAKFIIGSGENMSDFTYVENVSHAFICASEALDSRMVFVAGKAFFITNLEPMKFWEFVSLLLEGLGYQRPLINIPSRMALHILLLFKWAGEKLGLGVPKFSISEHYFVQLASRTRTFDCTAAKRHLGYSPIVSLEEGIKSTTDSFSYLAKDSSFNIYGGFTGESKMDKLLGNGKVADILLWRDEKETFVHFLVLAVLFCWFFLSGGTFASSVFQLLVLFTFILYGYNFLPSQIFGFNVQRMSESCFEISETAVKNSSKRVAYLWNRRAKNVKSIAKGQDWNLFFKVVVSLYILKLILEAQAFTLVLAVVLVYAFTAFFVYDQYETEIDRLAVILLRNTQGLKQLAMRNLPAPLVSSLQDYGLLPQHRLPKPIRT